MEICKEKECTGCMACVNACPVSALSINIDSKGFYIPLVDENKCIHCNKCFNVCPNNSPISNNKQPLDVYALWSKDKNIRSKSTSGGIFTGLAKWIIEHNGYVFGAVLEDGIVKHSKINRIEDINLLRGSKYVQSYIGDSFKLAKEVLDLGEHVLFSGTPCQIAGLYNYLGKKEYDNLLTMDIVCHGVPSPKAFKDYYEYMRDTFKSDIKDLKFRYKKPSWTRFSMKINFANDKIYVKGCDKDPYLVAFLSDYISRDCCHDCKFTNVSRVADLTAADFWSYVSTSKKYRNDEKGISLVLINSLKGKELFDEIKKEYVIQNKTLDEAKRGNRCLSRPYPAAKEKNEFWERYLNPNDLIATVNTFCPKRKVNIKHLISEEINRYFYLLPKPIKNRLNKFYAKKVN